jgi:acyl transferase domain-containing protein
LEHHPDLSLVDLCYTASVGRTHFNYRWAILAQSLPELQDKLKLIAAGQQPRGTFQGQAGQLPISPVQDLSLDVSTLAQQYSQGASILWADWLASRYQSSRKISLPTYPFQRQRFGVERT